MRWLAGAPLLAAIRESSSSSAAISAPEYSCCAPPLTNPARPGPSRGFLRSSWQRPWAVPGKSDLIGAHDKLLVEFRKGDAEAALNAAGLFAEHALRAIEYVRTGKAPSEIKSVSAVIKGIENDGNLPESLRVLVPRIASAALFDIRSKRGAAHVKEISPRYIDAAF